MYLTTFFNFFTYEENQLKMTALYSYQAALHLMLTKYTGINVRFLFFLNLATLHYLKIIGLPFGIKRIKSE
ncbi:hypothetical protein BEL04_04745 [Mucilaginibacter sp. PPCGB 2223]|nr:hypothetical protein BEL04_04745 [Mucilaginibacter sp. PPCGB 2223]